MSRFTDYQGALEDGKDIVPIWKHELLTGEGSLAATTEQAEATGGAIHWACSSSPVAVSTDRASTRTSSMVVPVTDDALIPSSRGSILHPDAGLKIRSFSGISVGGQDIWWTQSTMRVDEIEGVLEDDVVTLELGLRDMVSRTDSELATGLSFEDGDSVSSVVDRLLSEVLSEHEYSLGSPGFVMPSGSFVAGKNRLELLTDILEGCGYELASDAGGKVLARPIPTTAGDDTAPRWAYGDDGIPCKARRLWVARKPSGWIVKGGSFSTNDVSIRVVVYDTDPSSEGFFSGPGEVGLPTNSYSFISTHSQAVAAGYGQLRRHGPGPAILELSTIPNPAMKLNDLIELSLDRLKASGLYRVIGYSLPIEVDGEMTIAIRRVYDPAIGYDETGYSDPGTLLSFDDSFDRPDENLEDLETSPGSPDWVEKGFSWGVVGHQAIQRYDRGWSMAIVNKALRYRNQFAAIEVAAVPAGRYLGAVCRSSGEADGYTALCDSSNNITLEYWLNKQRVSTLGSYSHGSSLIGSTVKVSATGSTISVQVGSETVIVVSDDRGTGTSVGMLAYGGRTGNAPAVEEFTSGVL